MYKIVKKAIDEFDLFDLFPGAPSDEYDSESKKITEQINTNGSVEDIAKVIADVFSKAFNEEVETKHCMEPAEKIYKSIKSFGARQ